MKKSRKIISIMLVAILLCFNVHTVLAADLNTSCKLYYPVRHGTTGMRYPDLKNSAGPNVEALEESVDIDTFRDYLIEKFSACPSYVDISQFVIPSTSENLTALSSYIWYETPELFNINGLGFGTNSSGNIALIYASYNHTESEAKTMYADFKKCAAKLLSGIKDNNNLTDVEKALLLHDRLAITCEYSHDTSTAECYNAYGVFVNKTAVCMGYTLAYDYLLRQVGIDSYYCSSDSLNHAWNIVYINGNKYHVDVTWDDPSYDKSGNVRHTNFLRSTEGIIATGHSNGDIDFDQTPTDTYYDSYYWQKSSTAFQLLNNDIYYIDGSAKTLNKISNGNTETCLSFSETWKAGAHSYWTGFYAMLTCDGKDLLYSLSTDIYKYDVTTGTSSVIFSPDLSGGDYYRIYGFKYENCTLTCEVYSSPNFASSTKANNTQTSTYHTTDKWETLLGSSAQREGSKALKCINCGTEIETATLPKVCISTVGSAVADYSNCILYSDLQNKSAASDFLSVYSSTEIHASPSHNNGGNIFYGTDSVFSVYNGTDYIYDLTLVIAGDLNGDSVCDVLDINSAQLYSTQRKTPTAEEIYAIYGYAQDTVDANGYQSVVNRALSN